VTATSIEEYFEGKPDSYDIFKVVEDRVLALGSVEVSVASQISFGAKRKFAWFWLYNVTMSNRNGVPHLMLAIEERVDDPHVRDLTQVGKSRWNHQIVVPTLKDARTVWLGKLIKRAHAFGVADG
jgi:Domain of unknown function (DUF5655)